MSHRRSAVVVTALALTGATLVLAPSPAEAAVITTPTHTAAIEFDSDDDGTTTCTESADPPAATGSFAADGVAVTHTASGSGQVTDDNNAADKTTVSGSSTSTVTASQAGGQLSHVRLTATANGTITTAVAGTKCDAALTAGAGMAFAFDLVAPTLITVTSHATNFLGELVVGQLSGGISDANAAVAFIVGQHHSSTSTTLLPAGTNYLAMSELALQLEALATAGTLSRSGTLDIDISFDPPGSATAAQQGTGKKYVGLGDRDCTTGAVSATWTKKAGKGKVRNVTKATVTVDGVKVATVKKPKKKQVTKVAADPTRTVQVQIFLKVKGKGQLLVQRSYRACS
jgi:hypothetical protein